MPSRLPKDISHGRCPFFLAHGIEEEHRESWRSGWRDDRAKEQQDLMKVERTVDRCLSQL